MTTSELEFINMQNEKAMINVKWETKFWLMLIQSLQEHEIVSNEIERGGDSSVCILNPSEKNKKHFRDIWIKHASLDEIKDATNINEELVSYMGHNEYTSSFTSIQYRLGCEFYVIRVDRYNRLGCEYLIKIEHTNHDTTSKYVFIPPYIELIYAGNQYNRSKGTMWLINHITPIIKNVIDKYNEMHRDAFKNI